MPIGVADKLKAMTEEGILADSTDIAYTAGDCTASGNTIADQITLIHNRKIYGTEEEYEAWVESENFDPEAEFNIIEDDEE